MFFREMCSNILISLLAGSSHVITAYVAHKFRPPEYRAYLLFTNFYFIMEVFQASQWFGLNFDTTTCSDFNKWSTVVAYFLIWWQPYLFVQMGREVGINLKYARNLSIFTLIYAMTLLWAGLEVVPTYELPQSNFANLTHTEVGPYGHLAWYFSPLSIVYGPTFFVYFALIGNIIWFYPRILQATVGMGWLSTLVMAYALVGTGPDLPAFWCLLSVFADLPIILRCLSF